MPRGVYERGPSRARKRVVRSWRPGDPIPEGEPRRFPDRAGYVRLRWKVGPSEYVEAREHRFLMAAGPDAHVHHKNHDPSDNDPSNLVILSPTEHAEHHARERDRFNVDLAARLYADGFSTVSIGLLLDASPSVVYRRLRSAGVRLRTIRESWALRRIREGR